MFTNHNEASFILTNCNGASFRLTNHNNGVFIDCFSIFDGEEKMITITIKKIKLLSVLVI